MKAKVAATTTAKDAASSHRLVGDAALTRSISPPAIMSRISSNIQMPARLDQQWKKARHVKALRSKQSQSEADSGPPPENQAAKE